MSNLQVRTRGNSSPQGKPRVYFSCHPEDFASCFEAVAGEILQSQNCAIWYETNWDSELDESQLSQMQLFVIPVTTKYLTCPNRSRSEEYGFAIAQHIPVLPIMMESGLEAGFAEIMNREGEGFGDVQFLDRASEDNTAIPYAEKLEKRLSAILTSDETAARVRAAFDAYIFLSYRKKDRAAAQSLMRLIHQIPYCRDIAIWYDEFLVPGERWAKTIAEAMERSQLVTFAVTPHMMERGNYVMEHEFPEAMRSGKPLVPAEMETTERAALEKFFPGLPELVDGKKLADLEQALRQIALEENDHDPMHNYLIGLAYLGGIDVERDPERALELIRGAAEAQLPEAMSRLVEMYSSGEGVSRDYSAAVDWQKRLVELYRRAFRQTQSEETADALFLELYGLFVRLGVLCREGEQWETAQEMLQVAAYTSPSNRRRYQSISYDSLGTIAKAQERLDEAKSYYEQELAIDKALADETGTVEARLELAVSYDRMGDIDEKMGQLVGARGYYKIALALRQELADETGTAQARRDLSISYEKMGRIDIALRRLMEAEFYYERGLALSKELSEETGTVQARRDLAVSYEKMGHIAEVRGKLSEAETYHKQSLVLRQDLEEETKTAQARRDLAISYDKLGGIAKAQGQIEEAKTYYEQGFARLKSLAEETGTVQARRDLAASYDKLGSIAKAQGQLEKMWTYYQQGLNLRKALADEVRTVQAFRNLRDACKKLGDIAKDVGQMEAAKSYYEQELSLHKALADEMGPAEVRRDLLAIYNKLGDIAKDMGQMKEAEAYGEQKLALCEALAEETQMVLNRRNLTAAYKELGDIAKDMGQLEKMWTYYQQGLIRLKALARETEIARDYHDLAKLYFYLYEIAQPGSKEKTSYFSQAVRICEMLVRACPDVKEYRDMLNMLKRLDG